MSTNDELEQPAETSVSADGVGADESPVDPAASGEGSTPAPRVRRAARSKAPGGVKPSKSGGARRSSKAVVAKEKVDDLGDKAGEQDSNADALPEQENDTGIESKPRTTRARERKSRIEVGPPRLLARFNQEIQGVLVRDFGYSSPMEAPRLSKIVLNMGLGEALTNANALDHASTQMAAITGQKAVVTKARRSIAGFKIREGQSIGCMVTLRGRRMYEFLDRLINTAMPRIRDFRGLPRNSFDGKGNYAVGIREQTVFPEIDYTAVDRVRGLQISMVTTANSDREGFRLLELMGIPFARETES